MPICPELQGRFTAFLPVVGGFPHGLSPGPLFLEVAIKNLFAFTELHLSEIGEKVGTHDQTHLSKMFMKAMGITPLKYRIDMRNSRPQKSDIKTRDK